MAGQEMVIFTRSFDLLHWLMIVSDNFPKPHRHTLTRRLLDAAFDLREHLEGAQVRRGAARRERLIEADAALGRVRTHLRLTHRLTWISDGQYAHAAEFIAGD